MSERGGIGGIGFGPVAEEAEQPKRSVPRYDDGGEVQGAEAATGPAPEIEQPPDRHLEDKEIDLIQAVTMMREAATESANRLQAFLERVGEVEGRSDQLEGQITRLETQIQTLITQSNDGFTTVFARLNALAQQVMNNDRFRALDLAARTKGPGEQAAGVTKTAGEYLAFMQPPAPPVPPAPAEAPEEPVAGLGEPKAPTQH